MTNDWLTGIYLTTDEVLKYPDYVERLRDEIGLNTVVLSFTGQLSEEVLALSPYGGRTPTEAELGEARHTAFRWSAHRPEGIPASPSPVRSRRCSPR